MFIKKMVLEGVARGVRDAHTHVGFYPSSASVEYKDDDGNRKVDGACLRQQFYSHCGVERTEPMTDEVKLKLEFGNWAHEMLVEMIKIQGSYLGDEVRMFQPGPPAVSGRADLFVEDPRDGSPVGCEIKSVGGYYGVKATIKGTKAQPPRPKPDHILQCMPYLDFYGKFGLTRWVLLYFDRDSCAMAEYTIMLDDDGSAIVQGDDFVETHRHLNVKLIRDRWIQLQEFIEKGELPPRDYVLQWSNKEILAKKANGELSKTDEKSVDSKLKSGKTDEPLLSKGDWRCAYCDWKTKCYSNNPFDAVDLVPLTKPAVMGASTIAKMKGKKSSPVTEAVYAEEAF